MLPARLNLKADRNRLIELEALRGVAAAIVLLHHFLLVIVPRLHGRGFPDDPIALVRTPLFALVNGTAAVAIFFVLSGFVLTFRAMEKRDWRRLPLDALRRWPRLVPLVAIANLLAAVFVLLGLYRDRSWFGPAVFRPDSPIIRDALIEGVFTTFLNGSARFNAALWTMHYELFGSFAAYATGVILIFQKSLVRAMIVGGSALVLTAAFTGEGGVYYAMLVAGALVARIYIERDIVASTLAFMKSWWGAVAVAAAIVAVVLCGFDGYSKPVGFYAFAAPFASPQVEPLLHGISALLILAVVLFYEPVRCRLTGPAAVLLGRLSFPVYLVHLPILLGLVVPIHANLVAAAGTVAAALMSLVIFVATTLVVAYPLAQLDRWWVTRSRDAAQLLAAISERRSARAKKEPLPASTGSPRMPPQCEK